MVQIDAGLIFMDMQFWPKNAGGVHLFFDKKITVLFINPAAQTFCP